ncbi:UNVERIFIED_CONTAM: NAD(P)H-quinone oxidoreductase subunit T, chloroplastic [Sesamum radiatum]|uniref:NAD(P)H-quinone oxidoreductase subunit T, chloroplastic n=1 Tax=Sesamum radiatum TaxID=300843 RepID=A0AAW2US94_SESRA
MAAPTATPPASFSLSFKSQPSKPRTIHLVKQGTRENNHHGRFRVLAVQGSDGRQRAPPGVDTRIHWENEDEGWIGGSSSRSTQEQVKDNDDLLGEKFSDLLDSSTDSYYQYYQSSQLIMVFFDDEKRKFYDWTLAQEAASREAEKMRVKLEDPYMQEIENWESIPDMVDRLGGRNMELSDQAKQALTFDILIIIFSICCIIYVVFFKEPY